MSAGQTATVNGQPLSYWLARCVDPQPEVRRTAQAALQTFFQLPQSERVAFVEEVTSLLDTFWQIGFSGSSEFWQCLQLMAPLLVSSLPAFLHSFREKANFQPDLAGVLLDLGRKGRPEALTILLQYLCFVRSGTMPLKRVIDQLDKLGPDAAAVVPFLAATFPTGQDWTDQSLVIALGKLGLGIPTLLKALTHRSRNVRLAAARALGPLKVTEAVPQLIAALADDYYPFAATAAECLGKMGDAARAAAAPLTGAAHSRSSKVRVAAATALKRLPPPTAEELAEWAATRARRAASQSRQTNEDIVRNILENPDDVTVRLVYADWLDEQDNPRGEFIRLQCRLAEMDEDDPARQPLVARERQLLAAHKSTWRKEAPAWPRAVKFRRGFPEVVVCTAREFLKQGAGLFRRAPVVSLTLTTVTEHLESLAACPLLSRVRSLKLERCSPGLAASRHLANLTSLDLSFTRTEDAVAEALAGSPHLTRLSTLLLTGNLLSERGVSALARSPHLSNLSALHLGSNPFGDVGLRNLLASPHLANLGELALWHNATDEAGAEQLALAPHLTRLTSLRLNNFRVGDRGAAALARSPNLAGVVRLELSTNGIGPDGATALAESPHLTNLVSLNLHENRIEDAGAEALANSRYLTNLRTLKLANNSLGDRGLLALARSPNLAGLKVLLVHLATASAEAKAALKERFG